MLDWKYGNKIKDSENAYQSIGKWKLIVNHPVQSVVQ